MKEKNINRTRVIILFKCVFNIILIMLNDLTLLVRDRKTRVLDIVIFICNSILLLNRQKDKTNNGKKN